MNEVSQFSEFFDAHPHSILWVRPLLTPPDPSHKDFEIAYCNEEGCKSFGVLSEELRGSPVSSLPSLTDEGRRKMLHEMSQAFQTGQKSGTTIFLPSASRYFKIFCIPFRGGVLTIVEDATELNMALQEQERQRALAHNLLDASSSGIFVAKPQQDPVGQVTDFIVQRVNPAFAKLLSLSQGQLPEQTFLSGLSLSRQADVLEMHRRVYQTGTAESMDIHLEEENPDTWYQITTAKLGDDILVTYLDISAQKRAVQQIGEQLSLLENILRHSSGGIAVSEAIRDQNGRVTDLKTLMVNDTATSLIGFSTEAYLSRPLTHMIPQNWKSFFLKRCIRVLKTGKPRHTEVFWEPTKKWLDINIFRMNTTQLIAIISDISILKEAQLDLENSVKELRRSNTSLEEFTYAASHDLHEPLRKIQYFSERLKKGLTTTPAAESIRMLERMVSAATWMRKVIDDLLLYAKVSARPELQRRVNLNVIVQQVLEDLKDDLKQSGAKTEVGKLPSIRGDEYQLRQLFHNLICNALRFSKPGSVPEIAVRCKTITGNDPLPPSLPRDKGQLHYLVEVTDNGIGFEQEHAEKIFTIFERLHGHHENEGTGVGLAIVQKVVDNHHGAIAATSELGKGASFQMLLPA